MNIFFISEDPKECARHLDDKRVVKMVLETAQLLSTAINCTGGKGPYKTTHINHPCAKWTRESKANYTWVVKHFLALCNEYTKRYGKVHKCQQHAKFFITHKPKFFTIGATPKPNCAGNESLGISYKDMDNVHEAYKMYIQERWKFDKRTPTFYGKKL